MCFFSPVSSHIRQDLNIKHRKYESAVEAPFWINPVLYILCASAVEAPLRIDPALYTLRVSVVEVPLGVDPVLYIFCASGNVETLLKPSFVKP